MRTVLEYPIELEHLMNLAALGLALNTPSYHRLVQDLLCHPSGKHPQRRLVHYIMLFSIQRK